MSAMGPFATLRMTSGRGMFRMTCLVAALAPAALAQEPPLYLKCGRVFDGRSFRDGLAVVVRGGTLADVAAGIPAPEGATVLDLTGLTVLPGLIDAHTHIALHPGSYDDQILRETPELRAIHATVSARATLQAGITTIRDLGNEGAGFADVALRDAIARGVVPGPRILAAIQPVSASGSYGLVGFSPYLKLPPIAYEADGPAEVRRRVRDLVHHGADVVKIYMESFEKRAVRSDVLSGARTYSDEELRAVVDEAHAAGLKVAAHTYSDENARRAVEAGVDSIEHGLYLSKATFRGMAERGVAYVPTLLVYELWRDGTIFPTSSAETRAKLGRTVEEHAAAFRRALKTPVRIVMGSDTFEKPGSNAQEIVAMVRNGMSPLEALRSSTSRAAELLGLGGGIGVIEKGGAADLVALAGDPLADIAAVTRPVLVIKDGKIVLDKR
jgi:imidazolonepropionase-like amidohydrolase